MGSKSKGSSTRVRSGRFERQLSLTRMGLLAGSRFAIQTARSLMLPADVRADLRRREMGEQAQWLVKELGELKGSVVKIGQMMALYGEHFLPTEVTEALHTLEEHTVALDWEVIRSEILDELGPSRLSELEIDPVPIAAASLGQVHLARIKADDRVLCLKVQYPGVAESIDSDIDAVASLLTLGQLITSVRDFKAWLERVREMLHREVDYELEGETTARYGARLQQDPRFIVPEVYDRYSTSRVLATSFERGFPVTAADVEALPLARRNRIGRAFLELFLHEVFAWHEMQTDPNFGNYRILPGTSEAEIDRIVLLDFGAVQEFPESFMLPLQRMIKGAYAQQLDEVRRGAIALNFLRANSSEEVQRSFAEVCAALIEPMISPEGDIPDFAMNEAGEYCWARSELPMRIAKRASKAAFSRQFRAPPGDFLFLNRKLIGVYTFISVLDAQFNSRDLFDKFV